MCFRTYISARRILAHKMAGLCETTTIFANQCVGISIDERKKAPLGHMTTLFFFLYTRHDTPHVYSRRALVKQQRERDFRLRRLFFPFQWFLYMRVFDDSYISICLFFFYTCATKKLFALLCASQKLSDVECVWKFSQQARGEHKSSFILRCNFSLFAFYYINPTQLVDYWNVWIALKKKF